MKNRLTLNNESIAAALNRIDNILQRERIESNRIKCASLLLEEIMYIYRDAFSESADMKLETRKKSANLRIILSFPGKELNPDLAEETFVYKQILKQAPDIPLWEYQGGINYVTLTLPLYNTIWKDIEFAWRYTRKKKGVFFFGVFAQLSSILLSIIGSFYISGLIVSFTESALLQAVYIAIAIFLLNILEQAAMYVASRCYNRVSYTILANIQEDLVESVLNVRSGAMTSYGSGLFIERMTSDTATFAAGLNTVMDLLIQIGSFVGTLGAICLIKPHFFLVEIIILALLYFLQHFGARRMIDSDRIARKANEKYSGFITEIVHGFADIRTLHCEETIRDELKSRVVDSSEKLYALGKKRWFFRFLCSLVSNTGGIFIMAALTVSIATGFLSPPLAVVLFNYHSKLGPNVITTIDRFTDFYTKFKLSCERINALIYGRQFPKENFGTVVKEKIEGKVEFKDVTFSYRKRQNEFMSNALVLDKLSFTVQPKQTVAFVGASGCGKSTMFRLLDKLYIPNSGQIYIDDIDINDMSKDTLRSAICIINQSPYVFHDSIRQNLRYVRPDLTEEEMIRVCKAACIHDDIMKMDEGYDTVIGEGGMDISGGQKQRLAIARGLLCNASIFVLDEATSALDNTTQSKVLEAISNLGDDHTVLMIAHRLSTIIDSDMIFYIGDGHVVASGTHQDLLKKCPEYRELYFAESSAS